MMYKDAHATTTPSMARGAHSCKSIVVPEVDSFIDGEIKVFLVAARKRASLVKSHSAQPVAENYG